MAKKKTTAKSRKVKPVKLSKKAFWIISIILIVVMSVEVYYVSGGNSDNGTHNSKTEIVNNKDVAKPDKVAPKSDAQPSKYKKKQETQKSEKELTQKAKQQTVKTLNIPNGNKDLELPAIFENDEILYNKEGRYTVCYSSKDKQPYWVAYTLTSEDMSKKDAKRKNNFRPDPIVYSRGLNSATLTDYKGTSYDRGHLLPSADRDNSQSENDATFLLSNIAPQAQRLNRYLWSALENEVRKLATEHKLVYVTTGGVLNYDLEAPIEVIGDNVTVPKLFYKVLLIESKGDYYSIGYLMPNSDDCGRDYTKYVVTVDSVEKVTNIDFFYSLDDEIEDEVESYVDKKFWD
ncbi:MAG: DNA/RNA non-specific endonuclease [Rikenellaceae bacterium]